MLLMQQQEQIIFCPYLVASITFRNKISTYEDVRRERDIIKAVSCFSSEFNLDSYHHGYM
jgi:hypothetical protein